MTASKDQARASTRSGLPMSELIYTVHPAIKGNRAAIRIEAPGAGSSAGQASDDVKPARGGKRR